MLPPEATLMSLPVLLLRAMMVSMACVVTEGHVDVQWSILPPETMLRSTEHIDAGGHHQEPCGSS